MKNERNKWRKRKRKLERMKGFSWRRDEAWRRRILAWGSEEAEKMQRRNLQKKSWWRRWKPSNHLRSQHLQTYNWNYWGTWWSDWIWCSWKRGHRSSIWGRREAWWLLLWWCWCWCCICLCSFESWEFLSYYQAWGSSHERLHSAGLLDLLQSPQLSKKPSYSHREQEGSKFFCKCWCHEADPSPCLQWKPHKSIISNICSNLYRLINETYLPSQATGLGSRWKTTREAIRR